MASKRMAISALLSNDAPTSNPPSPAPVSSDEPPLKRQRQHQDYSQQYYDSYNAYPYSPNSTSVPPTAGHYPQSHSQGHPSLSPSATAPPAWPPRPSSHAEPHIHWDDSRRYPPANTVPNTGTFDFVRQHRQTSNLRGAEDDEALERERERDRDRDRDREREERWKPSGMGMGESLVSVLTGQMRGSRQGPVALPAPPQLRRDAQHNYPYVAPSVMDSPPPAEIRSRDMSPIAVKSTTPRTTPPSLSPRSSYTPQNLSPMYAQRTASPTTMYTHQNASPTTMYAPQSASPTMYTSRTVSPTTAYPPPNIPPSMPYAPTISPSTSHAPPLPRMSPTTSYAPPSVSPTKSYTPLLRASSRPPSSRDIPISSASRPLSPPLPPPHPPAPLPHLQPPTSGPMPPEDERSFEDELLSLVDGDDSKPKISHPATATPVPQLPPPEPLAHKNSGSSTKPPAIKPKPPPKPRAPAKSKAKTTARQTSGTSTPVPAPSMPPPSPPPKQQPAVARAKGKAATGAGGSKRKTSMGAGASTARSRSLSVKPAEPTPTPAPDVEMMREDDRLYCLCKTPYDEEKVMIACDRCDEWYHPVCVGMAEVEVDLVDQFICAACMALNPGLQTTYKQRCHRGLNHIMTYDSLPPCWKPARGAFSKYCSDDCGMTHMRAKIAQSGHDPATLWPAVKNARRREGVTVTNRAHVKVEEQPEEEKDRKKAALTEARKARQEADEREMSELLRRLEDIMRAREECKAALECVGTRRRLLDLAVNRAGGRFCGWDVRLEMGDEEWAAWVGTEAGRRALDGEEADDEAEWWCRGPDKCPRHVGWQNFRDLDVQLEVDSKNASIKQLTDRERELRRRIEDLDPPAEPVKSSRRKKSQAKKSAR